MVQSYSLVVFALEVVGLLGNESDPLLKRQPLIKVDLDDVLCVQHHERVIIAFPKPLADLAELPIEEFDMGRDGLFGL